ncbi:MAG: Xaa-Pro peptidase family protein [Candidatus Thorarchaeota archaeon]|nr:Xaa-Pro peptidase family protein [Candidatus Thorarchaeota archaeon]
MLEDLDRLMEHEGIDAFVAEGNAFEVPDIFWLTGFRSPDTVTYLHNRGEPPLVATGFNTLERLHKESFVSKTYDLTEIYLSLMRENKRASENPELIYGPLLKDEFSGDVIGVPDHIPASVLVAIQGLGYKIKVVPDLIKEARATKSRKEIRTITKAGRATIDAVSKVISMIKDSDIGPKNNLLYNGQTLTAGDIKLALDHSLLDQRAEAAEDSIVAVGKKGYDFHYLGRPRDPLKAGVPIIIDVFPRLKLDRYVADVTRTVVKGPVTDDVRKMFDAVIDAANASAEALRDGAKIDDINMACYNTLKQHGFASRKLNPEAQEGMLHGLGHGIGLEVHELPSFYHYDDHFAEGHVVAVEPGLYLKRIGGVRVENDFAVTKGKAKLLTTGLDPYQFV